MASFRVLLCDFCVILLFGLYTLCGAQDKTTTTPVEEGPKGNCSCGGFPTESPVPDGAPLLSQSPGLVIKCNEEGAITCQNLCTALAMTTKAKGPEILCTWLKTANELKLSVFYKTCDNHWTFANMTAEAPLCCDEGKVKTCASAQNETAKPTPP